MAVAPESRGHGVGLALLERVRDFTVRSGGGLLWCNARVPAQRFYEKHGWRTMSEILDIPTAGPHVKMIKVPQ